MFSNYFSLLFLVLLFLVHGIVLELGFGVAQSSHITQNPRS